jgi:hypothetical protein
LEGRDPHPLFDSDWYLEQNRDVAAAGLNPLVHYVRWGAADGRDPHPLFDNNWYKQNMEQGAHGANPLIHYVQHGADSGIEPNPLFDSSAYSRLVDVGTANPLAHYLGSELYTGLEADLVRGTAFSADVKYLIQLLWQKESEEKIIDAINKILRKEADSPTPHAMFARARSALYRLQSGLLLSKGNSSEALRAAKYSIALTPEDSRSAAAIQRAIATIQTKVNSGANPILLILSCEKHLDRAAKLYRQLVSNGFDARVLVGENVNVRDRVPDHAILTARTGDGYEDLAVKVRCGLSDIYEKESEGVCVFKMDDDVVILDPLRFSAEVQRCVADSSVKYAGYPVYNPSRDHHFGKTNAMKATPLGRKFRVPYANGPFYFLSHAALKSYYYYNLRFPSEISGYLSYEDMFLGQVMIQEGIPLSPLDAKTLGITWPLVSLR